MYHHSEPFERQSHNNKRKLNGTRYEVTSNDDDYIIFEEDDVLHGRRMNGLKRHCFKSSVSDGERRGIVYEHVNSQDSFLVYAYSEEEDFEWIEIDASEMRRHWMVQTSEYVRSLSLSLPLSHTFNIQVQSKEIQRVSERRKLDPRGVVFAGASAKVFRFSGRRISFRLDATHCPERSQITHVEGL